MRSFGSEDGTVDIEAVRDADHRLTGIVECPKEVYDYHTERAERTGMVRISKIQHKNAGRKVISDYY